MSCHRIDLAIHDGMLTILTMSFGHSLEAEEALLLREDILDRLDRIAGRPAAIVLDLRGLFEMDTQALELINSLEERSSRYANVTDVCHVVRHTPALETFVQDNLSEGSRPAPMFETCAEAVGFLTGADEGFEASAA